MQWSPCATHQDPEGTGLKHSREGLIHHALSNARFVACDIRYGILCQLNRETCSPSKSMYALSQRHLRSTYMPCAVFNGHDGGGRER